MLENEKKQILKEQLKYLYKLYEINLKSRIAIKNWCIVVWLGIITVLFKEVNLFSGIGNTEINPSLGLIILLPVFLFWFAEAVYGGQTKLYRKQIVDFEQKINSESLASDKTEDFFIRSHYEKNFHFTQKMISFCHSFFGSGTITFFYVVMFIISFWFIFLFFPNFSINFSVNLHIGIRSLFILFAVILVIGIVVARFLENRIKLKQ